MNEVLFRKIERLKEEYLYLVTNREKFLKSGIKDIEKFIGYIEKV